MSYNFVISYIIFQGIQLNKWLNNIYNWPAVKPSGLEGVGSTGLWRFRSRGAGGTFQRSKHLCPEGQWNIPTGGDPKSGCSKIDSKRARSDKFFLECLNIVDACWCFYHMLRGHWQWFQSRFSNPVFLVVKSKSTCPFANQKALSKGFVVKSGMQKSVMSVPTQEMWKIVGNWVNQPTNMGIYNDLYNL